MTVTTVFATAPGGDGFTSSTDSTYATARTGTALSTGGNHRVGQLFSSPNYIIYESHLIFATGTIPDTDTVSDVVLSLDGNTDLSTTDFNVIAASSSYDGGPTATSDWVSGASLSGLTTYATWSTSGYSAGYNAFTSAGAAFNSAINVTGNTAINLYSSRHSAGTTPTGEERVIFTDADAAGTTEDGKLDITHDAGGGGGPVLHLLALTGVGY